MNPRTPPADIQARIRCVDNMVVLDYGAAVYVTACFDVLERLAADR